MAGKREPDRENTYSHKIRAWLLPRPRDFIGKGYYFWLGFAAALALNGVQASQVTLLNRVFPGVSHPVPAYAILALGLAYYVAEEFLLQQSKLILDDILDQFRDADIPLNKNRALSSGMITQTQAVWMAATRWALALLLAWVLGGGFLLGVFVLISALQIIYEGLAKPLSRRFPLLPLICISPNMALRFLVGYMALAGSAIVSLPLFLMLTALTFYYFGFMANFWKMEAVYNAQKGLGQKRPQSAYYRDLNHSLPIQRMGALASIVTAFGLLVLYGLDQAQVFERFPPAAAAIKLHAQAPLAFDLIFCLIFISLVYTACSLILALVQNSPMKAHFRGLFRWARRYCILPLMVIYLFVFILSLVFQNAGLYLGGFLMFTFSNLLIYEGMTYEQFISVKLSRQMA